MNYRYLKLSASGFTRWLTLARPETRNAFNAELIAEITEALRELSGDSKVRALIIAAEGPMFCAGGDLHWMSSLMSAGLEENLEDARRLFDMFSALHNFPAPTIARVQGGAYGGGVGLLACCDMVVMANDALLAFSEVRIGLTPATIAPFVIRKICENRARELFMTGSPINAQRALEIGLVNAVVPSDTLDSMVNEFVESLRRSGPEAVRVTKRLLRDVSDSSLAEAREMTAQYIASIRVSAEGQEGMSAFLEKRKPDWVE